jgi:hypothetical protein
LERGTPFSRPGVEPFDRDEEARHSLENSVPGGRLAR